ncbi:MAG: hypothetical protein ACR2MS_11225 [Weeksellaceae bacterium]
MRILIGTIIIFCIFSCDNSKNESAVATYGDFALTRTAFKQLLPSGLEQEDSIAYANQIIEQWAKNKVLLHNSQDILSEEELEQIELKVAHYREDITTSFIEEKLMMNFNDSISDADLQAYYEEFTDSFVLDKDYLNYRFIVIPEDSAYTYKKLLRNNKYGELEAKLKLHDYAHDLSHDNWISKESFNQTNYFPEELKHVNINTKNQIFTVKQNSNVYIFELIDYRKAKEHAPLPIVKDMIKNVLINKRKLNLLSEKKKELYNKALQNDEIKRN